MSKFSHLVIVKSGSLLPMLYRVSELAAALKIPDRTLRDWLQQGAPHTRDNRNHIWIVGTQFSKWIEKNRAHKAVHRKMRDDEAYCFRCKAPVALVNPEVKRIKAKLTRITGKCPQCGTTINRGGRVGQAY